MSMKTSAAGDRRRRRLRSFLDGHFNAAAHLSSLPSLVAQLDRDCRDLDDDILRLQKKLSLSASQWLSCSGEVRGCLRRIVGFAPVLDSDATRRILDVELPSMEKEIAQIENLRLYAEASLQLEALIGDLEDATATIIGRGSRKIISSSLTSDISRKQQELLLAVKIMTDIENIVTRIAYEHPCWSRLLVAVDTRVEKNLTVLRPQALTDYRSLLASLGWPPSLSTSKIVNDELEIPNPLILMQGEKKDVYSQSFLALCALQHLQSKREARLTNSHRYQRADSFNLEKPLTLANSLWTIDELVRPIASRMEHHFSFWSEQPKFIFTLVYKIAQDFMDGVDNVLQPLIDKARLVGCSAKEAWISGMVRTLNDYLERGVFPILARTCDGQDINLDVTSSWLDLLDLMAIFNKRMHVLAISGTQVGSFLEFEDLHKPLSIFSIFNQHSDWLQMWAEIELKDASDKLKPELEDEACWSIDNSQQVLSFQEENKLFALSTREDFKAPSIVDSVMKLAWRMVERAMPLPTKHTKLQFLRSSVVIFLNDFFLVLYDRFYEIELVNVDIEDHLLLKAAACINAAHYIESVLREWSDDVSFLELSLDEINPLKNEQTSVVSFFEAEIEYLVNLETDCLEKIISAVLLQFDALCWEYIHNVEHWSEEQHEMEDQILDEQNQGVSPLFLESLSMLKELLGILNLNLNSSDFLDLWRSIADGLDHFIFSSVPLSNIKFSNLGVNQFKSDIAALLSIFRPYCARPGAFFPCTSDSLKLLNMDHNDASYLLNVLLNGDKRKEEFLRLKGLLHVNASQTEKILKNRAF